MPGSKQPDVDLFRVLPDIVARIQQRLNPDSSGDNLVFDNLNSLVFLLSYHHHFFRVPRHTLWHSYHRVSL